MSESLTIAEYKRQSKKPPKYRNRQTVKAGRGFHSAKEANRYQELLLLKKAGKIRDLRMQVKYPLVVDAVFICSYVADFVYIEGRLEVVEDTKGYRTREFIMKKNLMRALYGVEILET